MGLELDKGWQKKQQAEQEWGTRKTSQSQAPTGLGRWGFAIIWDVLGLVELQHQQYI